MRHSTAFPTRSATNDLPDDPPIPLEENIQHLQNIPPFIDLKLWAAWNADQSEIIGSGNVLFYRMEENKHLAPFEISILPEYRQQGLGRQFLRLIAETTKKENRRLLMTDTVDRVPAGEAFMTRIGAEKGLETHTNQLRITELDTGLIANWLNRYQENITEFELGFWNGAYPEEKIQDVAELYELTNQQPFGNLEIEDMHMTPEHLRQMEKNTFAARQPALDFLRYRPYHRKICRLHRDSMESQSSRIVETGYDRCISPVPQQGPGTLAEGKHAR